MIKVLVSVMVLAVFPFFPRSAHADACAAVEREMAFGEAAAEDAKDAAGYKKAADQFFNATQKAPGCAVAFYNLGVVQEKAGELSSAKYAFEKYLKLAPRATDAAATKKKIFKLEYRIGEAARGQKQEAAKLARIANLAGNWVNESRAFKYRVAVDGDRVEVYQTAQCLALDCSTGYRAMNRREFTGRIGGDRLDLTGYPMIGDMTYIVNGMTCRAPMQPIKAAGSVSADGNRITIKFAKITRLHPGHCPPPLGFVDLNMERE